MTQPSKLRLYNSFQFISIQTDKVTILPNSFQYILLHSNKNGNCAIAAIDFAFLQKSDLTEKLLLGVTIFILGSRPYVNGYPWNTGGGTALSSTIPPDRVYPYLCI